MNSILKYITPRISILTLNETLSQELLSGLKNNQGQNNQITLNQILSELTDRHGKYLHIFNLTPHKIDNIEGFCLPTTNFKWRNTPFSLTQTIKVLSAFDAYLRCNKANSIVFVVISSEAEQFCKFIIQSYAHLLALSPLSPKIPNSLLQLTNYQSLLHEFLQIFQNCQISRPPIKMIESLQFEGNEPFIPIFQIHNQFRHNGFEKVYKHGIQNLLSQYYLQLKQPLKTGIGTKYCQKKPETKYLHQPCLVCGDVKICLYSYEKLALKPQFQIGFNTKGLQCQQTVVIFDQGDFYCLHPGPQPSKNDKIKKSTLKIVLADYCEECTQASKCANCIEIVKKIAGRYSQTQIQLQKLKRQRQFQEIQALLSLQ